MSDLYYFDVSMFLEIVLGLFPLKSELNFSGRKTQENITSIAGFKLALGAQKHQNKA